jgi:putative FmdB family regulatory protein
MPIYEYRRPDGSTFEVMQSFADDPLTHDPETGVEVQRVLHAPAVHFKGKGFYNTDYGTRKRQRESAAANNNDGSSSDAGGESSKAHEKGDKGASESKGVKAESTSKGESSGSSAKESKAKPVAAKG